MPHTVRSTASLLESLRTMLSGRDLRVLFAEDVASDAELEAWHLRHAGIPIVTERVDTSEAFARALAAFGPDIVLSDYSMPSFDGIAALRIVIDTAPGTPFIIVTGSINEEIAVDCIKMGADDYVLKDRMARLGGAVLSALENHRIRQENQHALEALRGSEERFRALIENSSDGVSVIHEDGTILYASPSVTRILGYSSEEMIGRVAFDLVHPNDLPGTLKIWNELAGDPGTTRTSIFRTLHRSGAWVCVEATARNAIAEPSIGGVVLNYRDVTEQRRTAEALRQSEEKYRLIASSILDGIFTLDPAGRFMFVSPRWLALMGYADEEIIGRHFFEFLNEIDLPRAIAMFERGLTGGIVPLYEIEISAKDGRVVPIELSVSSLTGPTGEPLGRVGVFRDISERRLADAERRRLAAAVDQAAESIMITDTGGRIQYVNPAFERASGYASDEALGRKPSILKSGAQDESFYKQLWQTIMRGDVWQGHFVNRRKDGSLYEEEATISPIRNANGDLVNFVAVKRDVTKEMALEAQLRHAQKIEAIGVLAGGVAHDFNNLLQAMQSQVHLVAKAEGRPQIMAARIAELSAQIKRGASLTRELLLFARKEVVKVGSYDLNEIIRSASSLLQRLVRENILFTIELSEQPLPVDADRGQLEQVLMNLVVNAIDSMPKGGRLAIRSGMESADRVWVAVDDTGHGIPESIRDRVFEPFFTTKIRGKGTGLGLSVVHGIVTKQRGLVELHDRPEGGTSFRVILPMARTAKPSLAESEPAAEAAPLAGHGERVLLVEDEEGVRDGLASLMGAIGYDVVAVGSGEEARQLPQSSTFDVLLTDISLQGIAGPDLARELSQQWPGLKVVLMSGYVNEGSARGLDAEGVKFLQKPFDAAALAATINAVLHGGRTTVS